MDKKIVHKTAKSIFADLNEDAVDITGYNLVKQRFAGMLIEGADPEPVDINVQEPCGGCGPRSVHHGNKLDGPARDPIRIVRRISLAKLAQSIQGIIVAVGGKPNTLKASESAALRVGLVEQYLVSVAILV